ncbi:MAG: hypothetical protein SCK29_07485 [Bacillota bacterium]|nr:hypothetical protein [Bacillota bacterium]MDW7683942.1 hypothetical protein [Bacillota bacterium]
MTGTMKRLLVSEEGQGMTEYALIMACVVLLVIITLSQISGPINNLLAKVIDAFSAQSGADGIQQLAPAGNWDQGPAVFMT